MISPLIFTFQAKTYRIEFLKITDWIWLFPHPSGRTQAIPEPQVCEILQIHPRTAQNWRQGKPANPAALFSLYAQATGRILPLALIQQGIFIEGEKLHYRNRQLVAADLPEIEYLKYMLRELKKTAEKMPPGSNPTTDPAPAPLSRPPPHRARQWPPA